MAVLSPSVLVKAEQVWPTSWEHGTDPEEYYRFMSGFCCGLVYEGHVVMIVFVDLEGYKEFCEDEHIDEDLSTSRAAYGAWAVLQHGVEFQPVLDLWELGSQFDEGVYTSP